MPETVNLYDSAYGNYELDIYRDVRTETYGEDLGQTSWVTREESDAIPRMLELTAGSNVLELGCGAGLYALRVAEAIGCCVMAVDSNSHAIQTANELCRRRELAARVRFEQCDLSTGLASESATFDAVFANDVMCHIPDREHVFHELFRVLKPGGRWLFSDALVLGGIVSQEEIATRSSIGYYLFSPPGENERLLEAAGFQVLSVEDTSKDAASIAERWYAARQKRRSDLIAAEGESNFQGIQRFLECVHQLTSEGRLRRYLYLAPKNS